MRFRIGPWIYRVRIAAEPILHEGVEISSGVSDELHREILLSTRLPKSQRLDVLLHELRHCWLFHFARPRTEEEDCNFTATTTASAMADLDAQGGLAALLRLRPTTPDGQPIDEHAGGADDDANGAGGDADDVGDDDDSDSVGGGRGPEGAGAAGGSGGWRGHSPGSGHHHGDSAGHRDWDVNGRMHRSRLAPQTGEHIVPAGQLEHWETSASPHAGRAQCGICESTISSGSIVSSPPQWDLVVCGNVTRRTLYCPHCHHLQKWCEGCTAAGEPNGAVTDGPLYIRGPEVDAFLTDYPRAVGLLPA